MTWTKIPDEWTDRREFAALTADDRWHYLCMLVLASRGNYSDGILSVNQAQRASDHPNPDAAIARLEEVGLLELSPAAPFVRLVEIDLHFPPPSKRSDRTGAERQRRKRAHDKGDHTLCLAQHCPDALAASVTKRDAVTEGDGEPSATRSPSVTPVTRIAPDAHRDMGSDRDRHALSNAAVTRDSGTGRDGTSHATQPSTEVGNVTNERTGEITEWPVAEIPRDDDWVNPDSPGAITSRGAA